MSSYLQFTSPLGLCHVLRWLRYSFFIILELLFSWSVVTLEWAGKVADYILWLRMAYLTDVWMLDTTLAAAIVNVCKGVETIMPIGMAFLVDVFMGHHGMLEYSSIMYSFGMMFLFLIALFSGSCDEDSWLGCNISYIPIVVFCISSLYIAIGVSGHMVSLSSVQEQVKSIQTESTEQDDLERKKPGKFRRFFRRSTRFFAPILLIFVLSFMPAGLPQFGLAATGMVVASGLLTLFMRFSRSYKYDKPQGSPLTTLSRVFVASTSKMFSTLPPDDQLHENPRSSHCLPHTKGLRCLDKAAIVVPTQPLEQQEQNRWKLCSVTEVEEAKIFIRMIPLWMTFIVCGLVSSVGDTFFIDQASNLDQDGLSFLLLVFQKIGKSMFATVTKKLIKKGSRKSAAPIGNIAATIVSILCCITAAVVETRRLEVIKRHTLFDKPHAKIPMSMFWLLPQFFLLGALDGISDNLLSDFSVACFFNGEAPDSIRSYLRIFSDSVFGIGILGGVLSVYIVGKVKPSWFQKTLNKSRLDNYYWTLTILSCINLVFSILVALWYWYRHSAIEEIGTPESQLSARTENDDMQCDVAVVVE